MATVKGVNKTAIDAGGLSEKLAAGLVDGRVKVMSDYYTADATETAGTVIEFGGDLVSGAKVLMIVLSCSVAQASLTFSLGDGETAARYLAAGQTGLQTVGVGVVAAASGAYVVGTVALDSQIILTTAAATMTAGTVYCQIFYTTD